MCLSHDSELRMRSPAIRRKQDDSDDQQDDGEDVSKSYHRSPSRSKICPSVHARMSASKCH